MALENKIEELTKHLDNLSITVEELTHALKGENYGDHLTDAIIYLAKEMEQARKKTEA